MVMIVGQMEVCYGLLVCFGLSVCYGLAVWYLLLLLDHDRGTPMVRVMRSLGCVRPELGLAHSRFRSTERFFYDR
jgi:hypothetical protein